MYSEIERPSWTDYFKSLALLTATRSACVRLHVGCILVKDNRIISQGYNGYLPEMRTQIHFTGGSRDGHSTCRAKCCDRLCQKRC